MECLVKYLKAVNHVNNTNMFSQEFTDNIELQGKSSVRALLVVKNSSAKAGDITDVVSIPGSKIP